MQDTDSEILYWIIFRPGTGRAGLGAIRGGRPADELRQQLRAKLEREKERLNKQLEQLQPRKERLEAAISEAEAEVERLRKSSGSP